MYHRPHQCSCMVPGSNTAAILTTSPTTSYWRESLLQKNMAQIQIVHSKVFVLVLSWVTSAWSTWAKRQQAACYCIDKYYNTMGSCLHTLCSILYEYLSEAISNFVQCSKFWEGEYDQYLTLPNTTRWVASCHYNCTLLSFCCFLHLSLPPSSSLPHLQSNGIHINWSTSNYKWRAKSIM